MLRLLLVYPAAFFGCLDAMAIGPFAAAFASSFYVILFFAGVTNGNNLNVFVWRIRV